MDHKLVDKTKECEGGEITSLVEVNEQEVQKFRPREF